MCNELDVYNKDTESESVEEPDNKETMQRKPALYNNSTAGSPVSSYLCCGQLKFSIR